MKFKFLLVIIFVVAGIAGYGYFKSVPVPAEGNNLPKIEITPQSFDFGQAEYGQVLEYDFRLKNSGKDILEIKRVATSCACTSAKAALELLNPGQETNLHVTYNTGAMSGSHGRGQQERIIYVRTNDPVNPQSEVMIYANVK